MARRGFLDYVLSGAVGGLEGLAQQRAAEDEKKRIADALARQVRMDALMTEDRATEKEDREQAKKDRLRSQRQSLLAGGYLPTGRDMPGATPRQAVSTETVDGQEFALYSTPRQLALQAAMEEAAAKKKFNPEFRAPISTVGKTGVSLINPVTGEATLVRFPTGFVPRETGRSAAGGLKPQTATDATKEAQGLKFLQDNAKNQSVMLAIQKAIEDNPALAGRPGLVGYGLMQQAERKAKADAAGKPKGGGRTLSNPPGMGSTAKDSTAAEDDVFDTEWNSFNKRGE
jgi:hypothetical protein